MPRCIPKDTFPLENGAKRKGGDPGDDFSTRGNILLLRNTLKRHFFSSLCSLLGHLRIKQNLRAYFSPMLQVPMLSKNLFLSLLLFLLCLRAQCCSLPSLEPLQDKHCREKPLSCQKSPLRLSGSLTNQSGTRSDIICYSGGNK